MRFVDGDGECALEAGGSQLSGKLGGSYTVPTSVVLGDEPATIVVVVTKEKGGPSRPAKDVDCKGQTELRRYASFGVIRPGADKHQFLGCQPGGVALSTWGRLWVDGEWQREGLGEIKQGSGVRIEWQPSVPQIAWRVDGRLVAELHGDFRTHAFAVGGKNDHHTFVLQNDGGDERCGRSGRPPAHARSATAVTHVLRVDGMMCGHCTASVESALEAVTAVDTVSADLATKLVRVSGAAPMAALMEAVRQTGKRAERVPQTVLDVEGMKEDGCAAAVEAALRAVEGVLDVNVDLEGRRADVVHGGVPLTALVAACAAIDKKALALGKRGQGPRGSRQVIVWGAHRARG
jgi:copper chaperone CopZ